jgi:hypothetical protein
VKRHPRPLRNLILAFVYVAEALCILVTLAQVQVGLPLRTARWLAKRDFQRKESQ